MYDLAENTDGYERNRTHDVTLHVLPQLLAEIGWQLRPKHTVQRNRGELLESDRAVTLHSERVDSRGIIARDDDDPVAGLEVAVAEACSELRGASPEWLTLLLWGGRR